MSTLKLEDDEKDKEDKKSTCALSDEEAILAEKMNVTPEEFLKIKQQNEEKE